ncbi:hypothetical protein Aglo03_15300 [Actinokineospora globicatena]|uniref:Helix-turn-helix domain-containing protein n=1 Tax=Actinokineospora globicatena TaxID=103729 RepID=A0A9W6QLI8_9PSEU|nr:hypothetical protein Aglo03_15300 [Actinokineospora globicatena]
MGRRPARITDTGPLGEFATELIKLKESVHGATYRTMAHRCNFSRSVLAEAATGKKLPTWEVVRGFVNALGVVRADDVKDWEEFWTQTNNEIAARTSVDRLREHDGRGPQSTGAIGQAGAVPHPETVRTYDDLIHELQVLRLRAGNPSLAEICARLERRFQRHGRERGLAKSTLSEILNRRRPPQATTFVDLVDTLLHEHGDGGTEFRREDAPHATAKVTGPVILMPRNGNPPRVRSGPGPIIGRDLVSELRRVRALAVKAGVGTLVGQPSFALLEALDRGMQLASSLVGDVAAMPEVYASATGIAGVYFADEVVLPTLAGRVMTFTAGGVPRLGAVESAAAYAIAVTPTEGVTAELSRRRGFIVFTDPRTGLDLYAVEVSKAPGVVDGASWSGEVDDQAPWLSLRAWREAWVIAEYNHRRPDLNRSNPVAASPARETAPGILAAMPAVRAATLLADLPEGVAAGLLGELPDDQAKAVFTALLGLADRRVGGGYEPGVGS